MVKKRLFFLREKMRKKGIEAVLINLTVNHFYLTNYRVLETGFGKNTNWLLVTFLGVFLFTDSRYELAAKKRDNFFEVFVCNQEERYKLLRKIILDFHIEHIGIESDYFYIRSYRKIIKAVKDIAKVSEVFDFVSSLRRCKDTFELSCIKKSLFIVEEVLRGVLSLGIVGKKEKFLASTIKQKLEEITGEDVPFYPIVASSRNGAEPHFISSDKVIKSGEVVVFDVGASLNGYCSDLSRTVVAGGLDVMKDNLFYRIYKLVRKAQVEVIKKVRPGMLGSQVDALARKIIDEGGFGDSFNHSLGHGVGLFVHEMPFIGPGSAEILESGMVFTIEPGIYLENWGGVRLEEMVYLTKDGCEVLNKLDYFYKF